MRASIEDLQSMIDDNPEVARRILPKVIRKRLIDLEKEYSDLLGLLAQVDQTMEMAG